MMKYKLILTLSLLIVLASCNPECERGIGGRIDKTYNLAEFTGVDISAWGDIEIIKSSEHKLVISAQANLMERYQINVRNKILNIGTHCFNTSSKPRLTIYCDKLNSLNLSGSGDVTSEDSFISESLDVNLSGSGTIQLNGQTNHLNLKVSGSGDLHFMGMESQNCKIKISGSSNCNVAVLEKLDITISGSGKVNYKGYPEINQNISGSGKITSKN